MPAATLDSIFHYVRINKIVSTLQGPTHKLASFYGMLPGGRNVDNVGGDKFAWDLFDRTRLIAPGRLRATGPATKKPQVTGHVQATAYRSFEQIPVDYDRIFRKRGIGQGLGSVDTMGQRYLAKQIAYQGEKFANSREAMTGWMFKGGFDLDINGDDVEPGPLGSGGVGSVDFQHPATNSGTCDGVFAGNWESAAAGIIQELLDLNAHSAANSRFPQQVAWINGTAAGHILNNTQVKALGGTANVFGADGNPLDLTGDKGTNGNLSNIMGFVLRGYPSIRWFIYDDHALLADGTTDKYIPDGKCLFTPLPNSTWLEWKNGSEPVQKRVDGPITEAYGLNMWTETQRNPVAISMYALDNGLPAPYVPSAWYWADIHA